MPRFGYWSLCSMRTVAGSALGCGCSSWSVRGSERSLSGRVLVAEFQSAKVAARFGQLWAGRLPTDCHGCAARRSALGWAVSVPIM